MSGLAALTLAALMLAVGVITASTDHGPLGDDQAIRGWTILSDHEAEAQAVIAAAPAYRINQQQVESYPVKPPAGQWTWTEDAAAARRYYDQITRTGWPRETRGTTNPYGGLTFPPP